MSTSPPTPLPLSAHIAWCHQMRERAIEELELIYNHARMVMGEDTRWEHDFIQADEAQLQDVAEHLTAFLLAQGESLAGRGQIPARRNQPELPGKSCSFTPLFGVVGENGQVTLVKPKTDR